MLKKLKAFETKKIADFLLMIKDIKNKFYDRPKNKTPVANEILKVKKY